MKNFKFEVDLAMLRKSLPDADGEDFVHFCEELQNVLYQEHIDVVPSFSASNSRNSAIQAWSWPTKDQWDEALARMK